QLGEWEPQSLYPLMRQGAHKYQDAQYQSLMSKGPDVDAADRRRLLFPPLGEQKEPEDEIDNHGNRNLEPRDAQTGTGHSDRSGTVRCWRGAAEHPRST